MGRSSMMQKCLPNLQDKAVGKVIGGDPTLWLLISTPLLQSLWEDSFGTDFKGTLSNSKVAFVVYAFMEEFAESCERLGQALDA